MKIKFRACKLGPDRLARLKQINTIIREYQAQGYRLTLRQLYYQLVSRDIIPNKQQEYAKLSTVLTEGRMCGLVDWNAIEDRLRRPSQPNSWETPQDGLDTIINLYQLPRMKGQENYIEVWVEKDALSGVLSRVTRKYHIPIVVNRGYSSVSAMYDAYNRFHEAYTSDQSVKIIYLGDYDPSGMDMIRDIEHRICEFFLGYFLDPDDVSQQMKDPEFINRARKLLLRDHGFDFEVVPIALTRKQINQYNPPPNPAKRTDPRSDKFIAAHGATSWEVDALRPEVLDTILTNAIERYINRDTYDEIISREQADKDKLESLKDHLA